MLTFKDLAWLKHVLWHIILSVPQSSGSGASVTAGHSSSWPSLPSRLWLASPDLTSCWPGLRNHCLLSVFPALWPKGCFSDPGIKWTVECMRNTSISLNHRCVGEGSPSLEASFGKPLLVALLWLSHKQEMDWQVWQWKSCQKQWPVVSP